MQGIPLGRGRKDKDQITMSAGWPNAEQQPAGGHLRKKEKKWTEDVEAE